MPRQPSGGSLHRWFRNSLCVALIGFVAQVSLAQNTPQVAMDTNESLFAVLTAINACGYDTELSVSHPLREQIRGEVAKAIQASPDLTETVNAMCQVYDDHKQVDGSRTLAQYVSLALYLNPPPDLSLKAKEADLPPDAVGVMGLVPALQKFYKDAGIHDIWTKHQEEYSALANRYHEPMSKMLFSTEIYLRLPSAGYLGRSFTVYLDPMGSPGQTNARNYGADYYVVVSPGADSAVKMEQIRHSYLHYLVDPMVLKYPTTLKRLEPLLDAVRTAPLEDSFKNDVSLLVTECFIRAVEARTMGPSKAPEAQRDETVEAAMKQGFILTRYFYDSLVTFEKDEAGLRAVYGDILSRIDVGKENKRASFIDFASNADPELLRLARPVESKLLVNAEQKLSSGDKSGAQKLAQQALDEKTGDAGRALFILAEIATLNADMPGARSYFQRALEVASEPKVVAWSHIYLGRISDLQEERDDALSHYRAALSAGSTLPGVKDAAEHGLQQPYEPNRPQQ